MTCGTFFFSGTGTGIGFFTLLSSSSSVDDKLLFCTFNGLSLITGIDGFASIFRAGFCFSLVCGVSSSCELEELSELSELPLELPLELPDPLDDEEDDELPDVLVD